MSKFWKILISIILVLVVGLGVSVGVVTKGFKNWENVENLKDKIVKKETDSEKEQEQEIHIEKEIYLTTLQANVLKDGNVKYVSQKVVATITPASVLDKYVTWSLAWADSSCTLNLADYLSIGSGSQGNLMATINCYKSFKGNKAILTCTTRQGEKTATAEVVYEGVPSDFIITNPTVSKYNLGKDEVDLLYIGKTYDLDISMTNLFNDVGESYYNSEDYSVAITCVGTMVVGDYYTESRGVYWENKRTVDCSYLFETAYAPVAVSISSGKLKISVNLGFDDFKKTTDYEGGTNEDGYAWNTCTYDKFFALNTDSDGNLPYFKVILKNTKFGFSTEYKFFIGAEVESVTLDKTTVNF